MTKRAPRQEESFKNLGTSREQLGNTECWFITYHPEKCTISFRQEKAGVHHTREDRRVPVGSLLGRERGDLLEHQRLWREQPDSKSGQLLTRHQVRGDLRGEVRFVQLGRDEDTRHERGRGLDEA